MGKTYLLPNRFYAVGKIYNANTSYSAMFLT